MAYCDGDRRYQRKPRERSRANVWRGGKQECAARECGGDDKGDRGARTQASHDSCQFIVYIRYVRVATLLVGLLFAAVLASPASGQVLRAGEGQRTEAVRAVEIASGFDSPVHITAPRKEPKRLYIVERAGRIQVIENGKKRATPFLDIHGKVGSGGGSRVCFRSPSIPSMRRTASSTSTTPTSKATP